MDTIWLELLGVLFFVGLSALYSGSETALTALGSHGGQRLIEADPRTNRLLRLWVEHPYRALTAILVGNNLTNISATALMTDLAARELGDERTSVAAAIGIMTFLILTFGEITPKIVSKAFSTRLAVPAIKFVVLSFYLFWPITFFYVRLARMGLKITGQAEEAHTVTEDDIQFMVNLGTREGSLAADKERLLHSVFEYSDTTVKEVMVPRVDVVAVDQSVTYEELVQTLVDCGHSRIPVFLEDIDHIVGVFYAKDLLKHIMGGGTSEGFAVTNFIRDPVFVPTSKKVDTLFTEFQHRRIHIAIVVDEFGGTAGVVTLEDIIEEFFGEIQDEFDQEEPLLKSDLLGRTIADARVSLDELSDAFDLIFPFDHDYESLGGFISEQLGSVPAPGSELDYGGFRFTVLASEPTHVVSVQIEPATGSQPSVSSAEAQDEDEDEGETSPGESPAQSA